MKFRRWLLLSAVVAVLFVIGALALKGTQSSRSATAGNRISTSAPINHEPGPVASAGAVSQQTVVERQADATTPTGETAIKGYRDPVTGRVLNAPPAGSGLELAGTERAAASTSFEGLVEVPSPVPGGGVMVDLKGRFQSDTVGTVSKDGSVKGECGPAQAKTPESRKPNGEEDER